MTPEHRRQIALHSEGQLLMTAGCEGPFHGIHHGRATIDGLANALVTLDGGRSTAGFMYAVADRLVGGIMEPVTVTAVLSLAEPKAVAAPAPAGLSPVPTEVSFLALRWRKLRWIWLWWLLVGIVIGLTTGRMLP